MSKPIVLILGAGKKIGASTSLKFLSSGYRVASASRSANTKDSTTEHLYLPCDLSNHENITNVFSSLRQTWGEPSIVIYNASATHMTDTKDTLSAVSAEVFAADLLINVTGPYVAAKETVASFKILPESVLKAFIFTGNILNQKSIPGFLTLGIGKSATAYMLAEAAESYKDKGYLFHYVDERTAEGEPVYSGTDGPTHADFFLQVAKGETKRLPWLV